MYFFSTQQTFTYKGITSYLEFLFSPVFISVLSRGDYNYFLLVCLPNWTLSPQGQGLGFIFHCIPEHRPREHTVGIHWMLLKEWMNNVWWPGTGLEPWASRVPGSEQSCSVDEASFLTFFKSHQITTFPLHFLWRLLALSNVYFCTIWLSYTDVNLSGCFHSLLNASFPCTVIIFLLLDWEMTYLTNTRLICSDFFSQLGIKKEPLKSLQINRSFKFSQYEEAESKVNLTLWKMLYTSQ